VFHPKQKPWNAYLATSKTLQTINEISRILFAVLYVAARVVYFPYVIVAGVLPDCLSSAKDHPELRAPLYTIMVLAVLFTLLQLYWGTLVIKQIVKALSGGSDGDKKTKKA
jgi:TLC domain